MFQSCSNHLFQAVVNFAGGWNLTGSWNESVSFEDRIRIIHNQLGLHVFFAWGVVEHSSKFKIVAIAEGWNDAMMREDYLKLMYMYTILLAQAADEQVVVDFDYDSADLNGNHSNKSVDNNDTLSISLDDYSDDANTTYEYDDSDGLASNASNLDISRLISVLNPFQWFDSDYNEINDTSRYIRK